MQVFSVPQGPVQRYLYTVHEAQAGPRIKERRPLGKDLDQALNVGSIGHRQGEVTARVINGRGEQAMNGHADVHGRSCSRVVMPIMVLLCS